MAINQETIKMRFFKFLSKLTFRTDLLKNRKKAETTLGFKENCLLSNSLIKATVHKPYFSKQFESKYSLRDGFVHFSTFRLTLSELVLSVQHSHCLKIHCSEPFLSAGSVIYPRQWSIPLFQPTEVRFGGTVGRNKPTWSSVSTGTFPP